MMKKWLLLKNIPVSRLECKNHTLLMTKMAKIDTAEKPYKGVPLPPPPPPPGSNSILSKNPL